MEIGINFRIIQLRKEKIVTEGKQGGYQPSPEEISKAEGTMTDEQREMSGTREEAAKIYQKDFKRWGVDRLTDLPNIIQHIQDDYLPDEFAEQWKTKTINENMPGDTLPPLEELWRVGHGEVYEDGRLRQRTMSEIAWEFAGDGYLRPALVIAEKEKLSLPEKCFLLAKVYRFKARVDEIIAQRIREGQEGSPYLKESNYLKSSQDFLKRAETLEEDAK